MVRTGSERGRNIRVWSCVRAGVVGRDRHGLDAGSMIPAVAGGHRMRRERNDAVGIARFARCAIRRGISSRDRYDPGEPRRLNTLTSMWQRIKYYGLSTGDYPAQSVVRIQGDSSSSRISNVGDHLKAYISEHGIADPKQPDHFRSRQYAAERPEAMEVSRTSINVGSMTPRRSARDCSRGTGPEGRCRCWYSSRFAQHAEIQCGRFHTHVDVNRGICRAIIEPK
jgi:hypothetical protein